MSPQIARLPHLASTNSRRWRVCRHSLSHNKDYRARSRASELARREAGDMRNDRTTQCYQAT
jgi:hypothetical protein